MPAKNPVRDPLVTCIIQRSTHHPARKGQSQALPNYGSHPWPQGPGQAEWPMAVLGPNGDQTVYPVSLLCQLQCQFHGLGGHREQLSGQQEAANWRQVCPERATSHWLIGFTHQILMLGTDQLPMAPWAVHMSENFSALRGQWRKKNQAPSQQDNKSLHLPWHTNRG